MLLSVISGRFFLPTGSSSAPVAKGAKLKKAAATTRLTEKEMYDGNFTEEFPDFLMLLKRLFKKPSQLNQAEKEFSSQSSEYRLSLKNKRPDICLPTGNCAIIQGKQMWEAKPE